jgi:undecaprenyl-diphosphatase
VGFSTVLLGYFPELVWLVLPFTALVALSRPVLGLHYPSDVLAGGMLGYGLAELSFLLLA